MNQEYLKYYEKIDKKISMIDLTFDKMFKAVFTRNKEILKKFLISQLNLDMQPEECTIKLGNSELINELKKEYQKTVDIVLFLNERMITNIEVNRSSFESVSKRNYFYFAKLHSLALKPGDTKEDIDNASIYQLNINCNKKRNKIGEDEYELRSKATNKPLIDNFKIVIKNIEYYKDIYYNKSKKISKDKLWLVALTTKNFADLYKIISQVLNQRETSEFMESVIRMSGNFEILTDWERKQLDALVEMHTIKNATKEGHEKGQEQGLEEGREQGIKENQIKTAKRMLVKK